MVALIFEVKTMYVDKKGQDAHSWQRETEITGNCLLSFAFRMYNYYKSSAVAIANLQLCAETTPHLKGWSRSGDRVVESSKVPLAKNMYYLIYYHVYVM